MTQIPEEIKQQVQTSSLYDQEWLEVDILVLVSDPIGCTLALQYVEVKSQNFTLSQFLTFHGIFLSSGDR